MALIGVSNEEKIWHYLYAKLNNSFGVAGLMGNLYAESGLSPINLQNTFERSLKLSDSAYTAAVDKGTYNNFIKDGAGYGLAQWTYYTRKEKLLNFAKAQKKSIGDLEMQLDFLIKELSENYTKSVYSTLLNAKSVLEASNSVLLKFERPANQSLSVQKKRAEYGQKYYDKYANKNDVVVKQKEDDNLDIIKKTSTVNTTYYKNRPIKWIVIHYTAGTTSRKGVASNIAAYFSRPSTKASADFIVDDETIVQYNPDLKNRYCWSVGGSKYKTLSTSLGGKYHGQCTSRNAVNIEICSTKVNTKSLKASDSDWSLSAAAVNNAIKLTRYLMDLLDLDIDHVIMHHHVTGKLCPQPWTLNEKRLSGWTSFLSAVKATGSYTPPTIAATKSELPYLIQTTTDSLNIRKGPSTKYGIVGRIDEKAGKKKKYTIIKENNGWGFLKSKIGWISLKYAKKVK